MVDVSLVSNRLPIKASVRQGTVRLERTVGGLATGLAALHQGSGARWIGWPGSVSADHAEKLTARLRSDRFEPVLLSDAEVEAYYDDVANGVLWPLLHDRLERLPLDPQGFDTYRAVNERFADAIMQASPSGPIWVHDYHLFLLPQLLRERGHRGPVGYFLHVPFPPTEVFRVLPWRDAVLDGILGADLVGFHTSGYRRAFLDAVVRLRGGTLTGHDEGSVRVGDRRVAVGVFPIGVDVEAFSGESDPDTAEEIKSLVSEGTRLVLGIDRLDYTKGIPRRLLAIEKLLDRRPDLRGRFVFLQIAVPSREKTPAYKETRHLVDRLVGRINGRHSTLGVVPVRYLARSFAPPALVALYRAADVMLVTPLKDGMNLVAKEYCAARGDEDGVLVLSEQAGAAETMTAAMLVNPYDVEGTSVAVERALEMPRVERYERMRLLRQSVIDFDIHAWVDAFVRALTASRPS